MNQRGCEPQHGAGSVKRKSRAKRPCSLGGMGGKEERFSNHPIKHFLDSAISFGQIHQRLVR